MQNGLASFHLVLVVAPDRELRRSIEFALEAEGFGISAHAELAAALSSPRLECAACAVIDENAIGARSAAHLLPDHVGRPVVLLVDRLRADPQAAPGMSVLTKPLLGRMLVETVAAAIGNSHHHHSLRSFP